MPKMTSNLFGCAAAGAGLLLASSAMSAKAQETKRLWTPKDSVELRYETFDFKDPYEGPGMTMGAPDASPVRFSPDNRYFMTVSNRAELATDKEIVEIKIFETAAVRTALASVKKPTQMKPLQFFSRSSTSTYHAVENIEWDLDNPGFFFDGVDAEGKPHHYRADILSREITDLAKLPTDNKIRYAFSYRNGAFLYNSHRWQVNSHYSEYPMTWMPRQKSGFPILNDTAYSNEVGSRVPGESWAKCNDAPKIALAPITASTASVAPAGCKAIVLSGRNQAIAYHLIDLRNGKSRPISPALGVTNSMTWSPDGSYALLNNAGLRSDAAAHLSIFDTATETVTALEGATGGQDIVRLGRVRWLSPEKVLVGRAEQDDESVTLFTLQAGKWIATQADAKLLAAEMPELPGFEVVAEQDDNIPVTVLARNENGEVVLTAPDPLLDEIKRGTWQRFTWEEAGAEHIGAIMLPTNTKKGDGPPPVIIDSYRYMESMGKFMPDGPHRGADSSAQALAAKGFAVVWFDAFGQESKSQLELAKSMPGGRYPEGKLYVERTDIVIDTLAAQGLIDPQRIGIMGFSRGAYLALYHATHPGRHPVQAYAWIDGGYDVGSDDFVQATINLRPYVPYKGSPWINRAFHDELSTLRHVDKIGAPILFSTHYSFDKLWTSTYHSQLMAIQAARRPWDLNLFPKGEHQMIRPQHRYLQMTSIVDWFSFWMLGEEPGDKTRAPVWNKLRADWERQQAWEATGNPVGSGPAADF